MTPGAASTMSGIQSPAPASPWTSGRDTQTRIKASLIGLVELELLRQRQVALVCDARASIRQLHRTPPSIPQKPTNSFETNIAELKENMLKLNEESAVLNKEQTISGVDARLRGLLSDCEDMKSETLSICTTVATCPEGDGPLSPDPRSASPTYSPSPDPHHHYHTNLSKVLSLDRLHRRDFRDSPSPPTRHSSTSSFAEMRFGSSMSFASVDYAADDESSINELLIHPSTSPVMRHPKSPWASDSPLPSPGRRPSLRDVSPDGSTGCPSPDAFLSDSEVAYSSRGTWYGRSNSMSAISSCRGRAAECKTPRRESAGFIPRFISSGSLTGARLDLKPFRKIKKPSSLDNGEILQYPNPIRAVSLQSSACAGLLVEESEDCFLDFKSENVFYV